MTPTAKRLIRAEATKRGPRVVTTAKRPTRKAALPAFTPYVAPEPETYTQGAYPILALRAQQCRFACSEVNGQHRFCGAPAPCSPGNPHGSWCEAHRSVVFGLGTGSERDADRMPSKGGH